MNCKVTKVISSVQSYDLGISEIFHLVRSWSCSRPLPEGQWSPKRLSLLRDLEKWLVSENWKMAERLWVIGESSVKCTSFCRSCIAGCLDPDHLSLKDYNHPTWGRKSISPPGEWPLWTHSSHKCPGLAPVSFKISSWPDPPASSYIPYYI